MIIETFVLFLLRICVEELGGETEKRFYLYGLLKSIYNTLSVYTHTMFVECIIKSVF